MISSEFDVIAFMLYKKLASELPSLRRSYEVHTYRGSRMHEYAIRSLLEHLRYHRDPVASRGEGNAAR